MPGQQDIGIEGFFDIEAVGKRDWPRQVQIVFKSACIGAFQNHRYRAVTQTGAIEHPGKRHPGPLCGAHRSQTPLDAFYRLGEKAAAVAGAFEGGDYVTLRRPGQLLVAEKERPLNLTLHMKAPGCNVDLRQIEVAANVKQLPRGDEALENRTGRFEILRLPLVANQTGGWLHIQAERTDGTNILILFRAV